MTYNYTRYVYSSGALYSFRHLDAESVNLVKSIEAEFSGNKFKAIAESTSMSFDFDTELSGAEKTALDDLVANFTPVEPVWI
jgi:hypothetical protein